MAAGDASQTIPVQIMHVFMYASFLVVLFYAIKTHGHVLSAAKKAMWPIGIRQCYV